MPRTRLSTTPSTPLSPPTTPSPPQSPTSQPRNLRPSLSIPDLEAGCIVWLPSKNVLSDSSSDGGDKVGRRIRCIRASCCGNAALNEKGYNHPIVVLKTSMYYLGDKNCLVAMVGPALFLSISCFPPRSGLFNAMTYLDNLTIPQRPTRPSSHLAGGTVSTPIPPRRQQHHHRAVPRRNRQDEQAILHPAHAHLPAARLVPTLLELPPHRQPRYRHPAARGEPRASDVRAALAARGVDPHSRRRLCAEFESESESEIEGCGGDEEGGAAGSGRKGGEEVS